MRKHLPSALAALAVLLVGASAPRTIAASITAEGRAVLPLVLRQGFPLVSGAINGRRGYFMLDTGTPFAVFMNSDYLRLPPGTEVARGAASSGQGIVVKRQGCIRSATIADAYTLESLCGLRSANLRFVAKELEPRFLGFVGYDLFKSHRLTLDFARRQAVIGDRAQAVRPDPVTTFRFGAEDKNTPKVALVAGPVTLSGYMDTGGAGHINLTRADADSLVRSGRLEERTRKDGKPEYCLPRIEHDGVPLDSRDLPVSIATKSDIVLGFRFLKNYRSVWDFTDHSVRLYRAPVPSSSPRKGHGRG